MFDAAVIGGGIAGMATAARLQAHGLSTIVFEAHGQPGGCAGFFCRKGFAFDVGATTLVDFDPEGVGGELFESIGMPTLEGEALPGYVAWLPDRRVTLHRNHHQWAEERLRVLGDTAQHRAFWHLLDHLAEVFWQASRKGIKLPLQNVGDLMKAARLVGLQHAGLVRYVLWTMGDALRAYGLREDKPLVGLLSMLIEDTVHSTVDDAPLINAALGITIRGAGLTRATGGMCGFWRRFAEHFRSMGGVLKVGCKVEQVTGREGDFTVHTRRGAFAARQVIGALPVSLMASIAPPMVGETLDPYVRRDKEAMGGAVVVFLGVPEEEVSGQTFTHHQLLQVYAAKLGNGNNMFISVSAPGDILSAPVGHRAVMISTHCNLEDWEGLIPEGYARRKTEISEALISYARRVYPDLGKRAVVCEVGTPQTYARFTHRPRGAVGGVRLTLANANQQAIPHDIGVPGFWLVGDTTWPGLGTVACVLGSRIVAESVLHQAERYRCEPQSKLYRPRISGNWS